MLYTQSHREDNDDFLATTSLDSEDADNYAQNIKDGGREARNDDFAKGSFVPFDDLPEESPKILTCRAIVVGVICGALVNVVKIYMGLVSGWGQSASIFGASYSRSDQAPGK